ncbi:PREDICTED: U3 small nucleolar RNA-associated protein 14 homolog A-like [Priapulus caudatus]|uniref:U3 small nucleolar RNA-associated protein 14 homolog A-like n=1 Tax=Priapulus caudatus TaxID=37621 RepID=A0ABM1F1U7_PRICU|nr:PREDICTED: U3 small nucleolar RNA-associated protein 14 homolog A-like [Priapulus caudatus]
MTLAQAFEDDDVVEEFRVEKSELTSRDRPKDVDLTLPGWGAWGGTSLKPSKRRKRRFVVKAAPTVPRHDKDMVNVIVSEQKNHGLAKHLVTQVPFPFSEASSSTENSRRAYAPDESSLCPPRTRPAYAASLRHLSDHVSSGANLRADRRRRGG